jgi:multicomponent Na+:H+ antiporter subunit E
VLIRAALEIEQYAIAGRGPCRRCADVFSMTKIWSEAFWKDSPSEADTSTQSEVALHPTPLQSKPALRLTSTVRTGFVVANRLAGDVDCGLSASAPGRYICCRSAPRSSCSILRNTLRRVGQHCVSSHHRRHAVNLFLWNILLALAWAALSGEFTLVNLGLGFALGFAILLFVGPALGSSRYFTKAGRVLKFLGFFVRELALSNLRVAYEVITPRHHMKPGIVAVPLDARTDAEIAMLANLITLTPGTLSLDLSTDRTVLYVHAMDLTDPDELRREIKEGFERRVLEVLR